MKQIIFKIFITVALASSVMISAVAQETTAMPFAALPVNAETASKAGISLTDNILFHGSTLDASAGYMSWSPSYLPVGYMNINADYCLNGKISFSLDGIYGMGQEYDVYNSGGFKTGTYKPVQMLIGLGAGYRFMDCLSAQVRLKYMSDSPAPETSYGAYGADVTVSGFFEVSPHDHIAAEVGGHSIGTKVTSASGAKFPLPSSLRIAGAYIHDFNQKNSLSVLAQADWYLHNAFGAALAAEAEIAGILSVSAGYCLGVKHVLPSFASTGIGLHFAGININATCLFGNETTRNSLALSLGYRF